MKDYKLKRIICLYGGPGSGKSTMQAALFARLKGEGFNCEMIREYIKDWCWEKRVVCPGDQSYFFAKQSRRERILINNKLDFIINDSPLILTHFYGLKYDWMEQQCNTSLTLLKHHHHFCKHNDYKVDHFVVKRNKRYNPAGRYQTEEEARQFDVEIKNLLDNFNINYKEVYTVDDIITNLERIDV